MGWANRRILVLQFIPPPVEVGEFLLIMVKMGDADAPHFLQRLFALHHIDALGLLVAGGRRSPARLQDLIDLFLLHGTRIKVSFGVALRC